MDNIKVGDKAPEFSLPSDSESTVSLSELQGKRVVLFFYPKDDTPGCTIESCGFRDSIDEFTKKGVVVIGVSKDSIEKHKKFKEKHSLNFPLLSDADSDVCEKYGVWKEKSMFGKKYMGIERSTFLINEEGKIEKLWRKVSVGGHIKEVLASL